MKFYRPKFKKDYSGYTTKVFTWEDETLNVEEKKFGNKKDAIEFFNKTNDGVVKLYNPDSELIHHKSTGENDDMINLYA